MLHSDRTMMPFAINELSQRASGSRIWRILQDLTKYHRIQGSPGLIEALEYLKRNLDSMGISSELHEFPADGRTEFLGWRSPLGWRVEDAELWLEEPVRERIANLDERPTLVAAHSSPTDGWEEGDVVYVGEGLRREDHVPAGGKVALASGRPWWVRYVAGSQVKAFLFYREDLHPEAFPYSSLWPYAGENGVGLSISLKHASRIKRWLERGENVRVRYRVDSEIFEGKIGVLEAVLPGDEEGEVLLTAHTCHPSPGAHDNASGSAALMEVLRLLKGWRKRPTVRAWFVPEFSGTLGMLQRVNARRLVGMLNLDMVGADLERTGGRLLVVNFPFYSPSYMPLLTLWILKRVMGAVQLSPFGDGSDHAVFADPAYGIPATMIGEWPDLYYHSDMDALCNLDRNRLKDIAIASASTVAALSSEDVARALEAEALASGTADALSSNRYRAALAPEVYSKAVESLELVGIRASGDEVRSALERIAPHLDLEPGDGESYERVIKSLPDERAFLRAISEERAVTYARERKMRLLTYHVIASTSVFRDLGEAFPYLAAEIGDITMEEVEAVARDMKLAGWIKRGK